MLLFYIVCIVLFFIIKHIIDKQQQNKETIQLNTILEKKGVNNFEKTITNYRKNFCITFNNTERRIWCGILKKDEVIEKTINDFTIDNYSCVLSFDEGILVAVDSKKEKLLFVKFKKQSIEYNCFDFSSIISVELKENNIVVFNKSISQTVGKSLIGGALAGGAGAIVGGASASTQQNQRWMYSELKLLLRDLNTPSYSVSWHRESSSNIINLFDIREEAIKAKDIVSVVIDYINNKEKDNTNNITNSIADELLKLAKLRDSGIITQKEFETQKEKLLA